MCDEKITAEEDILVLEEMPCQVFPWSSFNVMESNDLHPRITIAEVDILLQLGRLAGSSR